jgi:Lar family restriction alleviation protein
MSDELRECPFCGWAVGVYPVRDEYGSVIGHTARCSGCGGTAETRNTEAEAAAAWNTRLLEDVLRAELETLRAKWDSVPWDTINATIAVIVLLAMMDHGDSDKFSALNSLLEQTVALGAWYRDNAPKQEEPQP